MLVSLYTLGCKQNYAETSHIREQFEQKGHTIVPFGEVCNIVIINTCTVTENADTECRKIIRRALRVSPNAFVGVTGCYAQLQPEAIASIDGVDAVFGAKEKFAIPTYISTFNKTGVPKIYVEDIDDLEFVSASFSETDSRTRAFLKIQDGCDYSCSFCTIPLARGASRSMEFSQIESEILRLTNAGFHEIILTGINLGEYVHGGKKLVDVLAHIATLKTTARFRLGSIEPNKLTTDIIDIIADNPRFCRHFHIPLQSGSPDVLRKMRRRYTADYYQSLVETIHNRIPDACIGMDVITGFPTEQKHHFEETLFFIERLPVSYLHVFTYSERDKTPAAEFSETVAYSERKERTSLLRAMSARKKYAFYNKHIGSVMEMIPESFDSSTSRWIGYTNNYIRVEVSLNAQIIQQPIFVEIQSHNGEIAQGIAVNNDDSITALPSYIPLLIS